MTALTEPSDSAPVRRVLDTSALLSGISLDGDLYTTPEAVREVRRLGSTLQLDAVLATKVQIVSPSDGSLTAIDAVALETGDVARLSPTDRGLLALARDVEGTVLTDDYSIQNVAARLGMPYARVSERGIREVVRWSYRCIGCGRYYAEPQNQCGVCGSRVRTTRNRPREP